MSDYLAIIPIGGGSSWGRAPDKDKAITTALKQLRDWQSLFEVSGIEVMVNVVDVDGYSDCSWGFDGLQGTNEATGKHEKIGRNVEHIKRTAPKFRRKS